MDRIALIREYLESTVSTMEANIAQHESIGGSWPYPGSYEEAKGRLMAYKDMQRIVR